jgi:hypothetical protein
MKALSNDDMARIVEYVDGTLDERERAEFELRMSAEPELAAAVEGTLDSDLLLSRLTAAGSVAATGPRALRPVRSPWWIVSMAAAAMLLFWVGRGLLQGVGAPPAVFEVALAAGYESPSDYVASTVELAGLVPPGLGVLRGATEEPNVSAAEFVKRSAAAELELVRRTAAKETEVPRSGFFVLPLHLEADASVLVFAWPEVGAHARLWPEETDAEAAASSARLVARDHVLPRPRIEHFMPDDRLVYHRGFLVPFGARSVQVWFAARAAALDAADVTAVDAALATGPDALRRELDRLGFRVAELRVDEP